MFHHVRVSFSRLCNYFHHVKHSVVFFFPTTFIFSLFYSICTKLHATTVSSSHDQSLAPPDICNILINTQCDDEFHLEEDFSIECFYSSEEDPESSKQSDEKAPIEPPLPKERKPGPRHYQSDERNWNSVGNFLPTCSPKFDSTNSGIRDTYPLPNLNGDDGNVRPEVPAFLHMGDEHLMNMVASEMKNFYSVTETTEVKKKSHQKVVDVPH